MALGHGEQQFPIHNSHRTPPSSSVLGTVDSNLASRALSDLTRHRVDATHCTSNAEKTRNSRPSSPASSSASPSSELHVKPRTLKLPRRVLKPDGWWQKSASTPPPLPPRSPLRPSPANRPFGRSTSSPVPAPRSLVSESEEDQLLRAELTPPPLQIRKTSHSGATFGSNSPAILTTIRTSLSAAEAQYGTLLPRSEPVFAVSSLGARASPLELEGTNTLSLTSTMDSLHPQSAAAMTAHRREAIRLAKEQELAVAEKCKRSNQDIPDYTFDELIGKGSFGRVYKGRQTSTSTVVAIKVIDIDEADFQAFGEQKDEQIRDFNKEIRILRQAQESGAVNLNQIINAMPVHSQLWMVCEYCPGGSVKTLMRATNDRLSEKYTVVVARELAKALEGLHKAGIIHRDVKAANVLIHEEGRLQLCDFGVAGVLETQTDKRRTFIGTLHWMPPELWSDKPDYSDEVDVWEYGCTLYECAVGRPPNSDLRERQQLKMRMRRLKQAINLPESEDYSSGLRDLVQYTLSPDVHKRPSMKDVLQHEFLASTEESHPTSSLQELVKTYYSWLFGGGQRISLFMPGGAAPAAAAEFDDGSDDEEWNFSMTQDFEKRVSSVLEIPDFATTESGEGEATPRGPRITTGTTPPKEMTAAQKANFEARVKRGADLSSVFDQEGPEYEYKIKQDFVPLPEQRRISDLPFRAMAEDRPSSIASNVIDLGDFDEADYAVAAPRTDDKIQTAYAGTPMKSSEDTFRLADASTLRAKRADSKGPRERSATRTLTARRTSSTEVVPVITTAGETWNVKENGDGPELQDAAQITMNRDPKHMTMEWSFAAAMSAVPPATEAKNQDATAPEDHTAAETKAKKHATIEWSFASAMAEVDQDQSTVANEMSPVTKTTPRRPAQLMRMMTMPVTSNEVQDAEEMPRPLTALSEAHSESSMSSADFDPFALERDQDDLPGPATLDEAGISNFYATRGRQLVPSEALIPPFDTEPISEPGPYPLGRPARIGDEEFPGSRVSLHGNNRGSGSSGRVTQVVDMPEAVPPSMAALAGNAHPEEMERELERLLGDLHSSLQASSVVVQGRRRRGRARPSSSEWNTEEDD